MTLTPPITTRITPGNKIRKAFGMSADGVFFWANWTLLAALIIGVVSTYLIVVSGNAKEANLKLELKEKDDALDKYKTDAASAITVANVVAASAKSDAAKANQRAEELRADNLTLQAGVRPRRLSFLGWTMNPDRVAKLYDELDKYSGTLVLIQSVPDFEPQGFARDIASVLASKKWNVKLVSERESRMPDVAIPEGVSIFSLTDGKIESNAGGALWQTMLGAFHEMGMTPPTAGTPVVNWGNQRQPWMTFNFDPPVMGIFVCVGRTSSSAFLDTQRKELVRQRQDWDDNLKAMVRSGHKVMSQATDGTMVETIIGSDGELASADPNKKLFILDKEPTLVLPGGVMIRSTPFPEKAKQ